MIGRVELEIMEDNKVVVFVKNIDPYDSIRVLISTALALLEGTAEVTVNGGHPLTEDEEREIMESLVEGVPSVGGGQRDN